MIKFYQDRGFYLGRKALHCTTLYRAHDPNLEEINEFLIDKGTSPIKHGTRIESLAARPQLKLEELMYQDQRSKELIEKLGNRKMEILESVEILPLFIYDAPFNYGLQIFLKKIQSLFFFFFFFFG